MSWSKIYRFSKFNVSHIGPYTPFFGFGYGGIGNVLTMWPPMFDPLINPTASPKLVSRIAQARIVTDHGESSDEDKDYSKENTTPRCHESFLPVPENCNTTKREDHPRLEMLVYT
jgi:hypothetical protein